MWCWASLLTLTFENRGPGPWPLAPPPGSINDCEDLSNIRSTCCLGAARHVRGAHHAIDMGEGTSQWGTRCEPGPRTHAPALLLKFHDQ